MGTERVERVIFFPKRFVPFKVYEGWMWTCHIIQYVSPCNSLFDGFSPSLRHQTE